MGFFDDDSGSHFKWMLSEDPEMIFPVDNNASFYLLLAGIPISFLLLFIAGSKTKK